MTPAARYAAAIEVLDRWEAGLPAEQALTRWARGARYAGSKDRAAVRDHVYDVLRLKQTVTRLGGGIGGRAWVLGLLRWHGIAPETVFTGEGHAPAPLSPSEMQRSEVQADPAEDVPDWMLPLLRDRFGAGTEAALTAFQSRAPLYLRINRRQSGQTDVVAVLAQDGVVATHVPNSPGALMVQDGVRRVRQAQAFLSGLVEIQDLSVQRAVAAVPWPETGRILDYCAGGGGKSLALADHTQAALFAHDAKPARMADLAPRAERAGVQVTELATAALPKHGPFDAILCDVPCSGSGTWRRDPEAKWRLTPADLAALTTLQDQILAEAAALLRPGGLLVYMTCSLFAEENETRISRFQEAHPGWHNPGQIVETPLTASDGFFAAWMIAPGNNC